MNLGAFFGGDIKDFKLWSMIGSSYLWTLPNIDRTKLDPSLHTPTDSGCRKGLGEYISKGLGLQGRRNHY